MFFVTISPVAADMFEGKKAKERLKYKADINAYMYFHHLI